MENPIYSDITDDRKKYFDAILNSEAAYKVVVAGPGTGKTFLFNKLIESKPYSIILTFINSLVEDLSLELYGLTDVRTLHGFARSILSKLTRQSIKIFPKLSDVIKEDALILLEEEIEFEKLLYRNELKEKYLEFYSVRKNYYGYYGYTDIIFAAVKYFEKHGDSIPSFQQILVDEYQDFNELEVSLIDLLSKKSPVLLAGDDDQALYDFKNASTKYIRDKFSESQPIYESFTLPYCSRSTSVIVNAIDDIIQTANQHELLKNRIPKEFIYFNDVNKDKECDAFPTIQYTHKYDSQIPWFITSQIAKMAKEIRVTFNVLIISPYRKKSEAIVKILRNYGLKNIDCKENTTEELNIFDGIKLILENINSKLGWRIILKWILNQEEWISFLTETNEKPDVDITSLISNDQKRKVKKIVSIYRKIVEDREYSQEDFDYLLNKVGINPMEHIIELMKNAVETVDKSKYIPAISKINIKASTIQSSKGLSADLVFITHFDDRYFITDEDKSNISDKDICSFIVALSRARKQVYLISSVKGNPIFKEWINPERIINI